MARHCPYCRKKVKRKAVVCPHCTRDLPPPAQGYGKPILIGLTIIFLLIIFMKSVADIAFRVSTKEKTKITPTAELEKQKSQTKQEMEKALDEAKKEREFKNREKKYVSWARKTGGVDEIKIVGDGLVWVILTPEKYTTKENVEAIARSLACAYKKQTGYDGTAIVTVWPSVGGTKADSVAKGSCR